MKCTKCKTDKPETEFNPQINNKGWCNQCQRSYGGTNISRNVQMVTKCPECGKGKMSDWFAAGDRLCRDCRRLVDKKVGKLNEKTAAVAAKAVAPRLCRMCETTKPANEFYASGSYCKECLKRLSHRVPYAERKNNALKKYGMTLPEFIEMLEGQGGVCACCGEPETVLGRSGKPRALGVDLDKETLKVWGLVCNHCKRGLDHFNGDANRLYMAIDYVLERK